MTNAWKFYTYILVRKHMLTYIHTMHIIAPSVLGHPRKYDGKKATRTSAVYVVAAHRKHTCNAIGCGKDRRSDTSLGRYVHVYIHDNSTNEMLIKTKQHNTTERQSNNNTTQLHLKQSFFKEKMSCLRWDSNPRPSVF